MKKQAKITFIVDGEGGTQMMAVGTAQSILLICMLEVSIAPAFCSATTICVLMCLTDF